MFYLVNLPDALNARLEAASTRAESKFVQDAKRLPGYTTPHIPDQPSPWFAGSAPRRLLINRIVTEVLEVGHAVCVSASKGEVRAHKIGGIVDDILELRCSKLCPDPYRTMGGDRSSGFLSEVRKKLFDSPEWEAHLTETCEVLEAQADEATHAATPASSGAECVFRHEAERWNIRYDGQKWSGKSRLVGLSLIQMLLGSPHNEIRSETLLGRKLEEYRDDPHGPPEQPVSSAAGSTADTLVDDTAIREARKRMSQLEEELQFARISQDKEKESVLAEEFLSISRYLRTSPTGQPRRANSDQERARKTAQGQYRRALEFLTKHNLDRLREHLEEFVTSGTEFIYKPKPDVDWLT